MLLGLSALHVAAIAFYLVVKRQNLITAMVTGSARGLTGAAVRPLVAASWWRLAIAILLSGALAYGVAQGLQF